MTQMLEKTIEPLIDVHVHRAQFAVKMVGHLLISEPSTVELTVGRLNWRAISVFPTVKRLRSLFGPIEPRKRWGDGIRRSAGAAFEINDFDEVFAQIERERKAAKSRAGDE